MYGLNLPHLTAGNHTATSGATPNYNCVSHAVFEEQISLWPDENNRWPSTVPREETLTAFVELFRQLGYATLPVWETGLRSGYGKIAIYAIESIPTHVARQCRDGRWTSKLGIQADISHRDLNCLEHGDFGVLAAVMERKHTGSPPALPPVIPPRPLIILP